MPININVGSQFNVPQGVRAHAEAVEFYRRKAAELDVKARLDVASAKKAAKDAGVEFNRQLALENTKQLRVEAIIARGTAAKVKRELDAELKAMKSPVVDVETRVDRDRFGRVLSAVAGDAAKAGAQAGTEFSSTFMKALSDLGTALPGGLRGVGGLGIFGALAVGLTDLAGIAASAAQSVWLLPAAAGAAGAALGTLTLITAGTGNALDALFGPQTQASAKKFDEAMQRISPNAQQVMLSIKAMMPEFTKLQYATQNSFFAGMGQQLNRLVTQYLPSIQTMTAGIAGSFNQMFMGISNQLMTPGTQASMQQFMNNITASFQALGPAAAPFTKALADIMAVGSGFLPELARSVTNAANAFSKFITHARETGELKKWMGEGLDTLKQLGEAAIVLGQAFMQLAPLGRQVLPDIIVLLKAINTQMPAIVFMLESMQAPLKMGAAAAEFFGTAFGKIQGVVERVVNAIIPVINRIGEALNTVLAPIRAAAKLIGLDIPEFTPLINRGGRSMRKGAGAGGLAGTGIDAGGTGGSYPSGGYPWEPGSTGGAGGSGHDPSGWFPGPGVGSWGGPPEPNKPNADGTWGKKPTGAAAKPFIDPKLFMAGDPLAGMPRAVPGSDAQKVYSADSALIAATHNLEQQRLALLVLKAEGNHTQQEILTAENNIQEQERALYDAQFKDLEARTQQMKQSTTDLSAVFVPLEEGFGIAGGIPGVIKNLTILMGDLALAGAIRSSPSLQAGALALMNPQGSSGASGLSQLGPAALQQGAATAGAFSGGAPLPGESARDFAHRVMMPHWQSEGFTVGDHGADKYGEHQHGALDVMVPSIAAGSKVLQEVLSDPNVYGAIFNQRSYGYGHGTAGTPMEDRGSPTQNHQDHVHVWYKPGDPGDISPGGFTGGGGVTMPASSQASFGGGSIPIPLPVTIVGGGAPSAFSTGSPAIQPPGIGGSGGAPGPSDIPSIMGPNIPFGGGSMLPGVGMPQGLGPGGGGGISPGGPGGGEIARMKQPWGGSGIDAQTAGPPPVQGRAPSSSKGGTGDIGGPMLDMAVDAATSGLDVAFPGAGTAAKIGVQLAKRTIKFGGELAAIGAGGLMETFLPNGSALGDPSKSWLGKGLAGVSGARPSPENTAGKTQPPAKPVDPNTKEHGSGGGQPPGPTIGNVNFSSPVQDQQSMVNDIDRQNRAHGAGMGR